jgi:alginate O-acetyltransferase complex protein AlgI
MGTLRIILPAGISFFTFQTLSYTIDVYRKDLRECRSLPDLALFIAFFPQLVAGPIVRAAEFMPQLETPRTLSWRQAYVGLRIFVFGFFKKVFLADRLAPFVETVFSNAGAFDGATVWLGVLAYAVQIYCDFSGYSDMAIGMARIMGYEFSINFNTPYIARSIQEFWHRWHISLSTWLRDYLYIPLGGSRHGRARTYINLMVTMLLGGLWHGASWAFVFWGGLHGAALALHRGWCEWRGKKHTAGGGGFLSGLAGWSATMLIVLVGWVFFRAGSFEQAGVVLNKMFIPGDGVRWIHPFALTAVLALAAQHSSLFLPKRPAWMDLPVTHWITPAALVLLFGVSILFYPTGFTPFIYFQF